MSRPGVLTVYRWELRKLRSQKRTYIGIAAAMLLPVLFTVVLAVQKGGGPTDEPLGVNLKISGIILVLIVLTFVSRFAAQVLAALVAGDIVAAETSGGTLKLVLTRSVTRNQLLTGKVLATYTYRRRSAASSTCRGCNTTCCRTSSTPGRRSSSRARSGR